MKTQITNEQVNEIVSKFLSWKLPDDFQPDAGIAFSKPESKAWWPTGTNLMNANQAKEMVKHILGVGD